MVSKLNTISFGMELLWVGVALGGFRSSAKVVMLLDSTPGVNSAVAISWAHPCTYSRCSLFKWGDPGQQMAMGQY